ncbi:MAG TPA: glycoside hydrolase family 2 TIM barrel-domain containing protein [Chthoniobacteraceae bacterium]|jgi:hypothetical protein|nr:glycoside hydrolase family 2 TIM barrel-domain containing protein [Chthoniobacteraceae bacterium]
MRFTSVFAILTAVAALQGPLSAAEVSLPPSIPGHWETIGRLALTTGTDSITVGNGYVADLTPLGDCSMTFRARMPESSGNVQIWAAIRMKDRFSRYAFALRGGVEPEITLARYAPDGQSKFLGFAPLDFTPQPGRWYTLRVMAAGNRFQVYLNDEKLPRINIEDKDALWKEGGVGLGGGWLRTEFADLKVTPLMGDQLAGFEATGTNTWQPPQVDKSALRAALRAAYRPVNITVLPPVRGEISLDGQWLFEPDNELPAGTQPYASAADDNGWNVLPVPSFWTPTIGWLHGESGMPDLKGLEGSRGPSDKLMIEEYRRVNAQTFDWQHTKGGWYRHHLFLPPDIHGREFHLVFDAIAKIADVWVNGRKVCTHTGMFSRVDADITAAVRPGENIIAVHDTAVPDTHLKDANAIAGTAVTVDVTNEMLQSLPHGMADASSGGIWQPVKLVVTTPVHISDVFVQPALDGARTDVEIENDTAQARNVALNYSIVDAATGSVLCSGAQPIPATLAPLAKSILTFSTPRVSPKLWSPASPNLYSLVTTVSSGGAITDRLSTRFGFRTFQVRDGKLMLNGHPYWLLGADHFPCTLRPNDATLAHVFMRLARQGNVYITRSHSIPFTAAWLDAADEVGIGVSYEGTWPWLMLKGPPPPPDLIQDWKDEFASLLKEYRNHPSILIWDVNNEMKFEASEKKPDILLQKWTILDDMIRTMRKVDPTRPIVPDSSYTRKGADKLSGVLRQTHHFDDGDIDDAHCYFGTYGPSFFCQFNGELSEKDATPGRPLISQEMSTGYPRNDDWPSRSYEFPRYVPQAIAGDYAIEGNDPSIYLTRQALMTKELAEALRRTNRDHASGFLHFAYLTWFTDVWKPDSIRPKLTYYELQKALQPVLASAELYGRHFYAGTDATRRVCLINDSQDAGAIPAGTLQWQITAQGRVLSQGSAPTPGLPYYSNTWMNATFRMPAEIPDPKTDAVLNLYLVSGRQVVSRNSYDITLGAPAWAAVNPSEIARTQLYDPHNLSGLGSAVRPIASLDGLDPTRPLIVGDTGALMARPDGPDKLRSFANAGGRVLLLNPGAALTQLYPQQIKSYRHAIGEIVMMQIPESPVFDGIDPLDTAWFEMGGRQLPYASTGTYEVDRSQPGVLTLAQECALHGDLKGHRFSDLAGSPLVEIQTGKGCILASELNLSARDRDPIAGRLLHNMVHYLEQRTQ